MLDALLDKSVVGYTALGYRWRPHPEIDADLRGRFAMVTGATSGLGRATAFGLARLGATVTVVGRNPEKTERVAQEIREETGNEGVRGEIADLSSLQEVRDLADRTSGPLHVLVNNAGVLLRDRSITVDGYETTFATNLLGQHLLTERLIDEMEAPARIIFVSSGGMYTQRLRVDELEMSADRYDGVTAYARTKRAQVVLAELWAERLRDRGVVVHSMHPGWAATPGVSGSLPTFYKLTKAVLRTPEQGADTIVWLCASEEAARTTGKFWHDRRPRPTHRSRRTQEGPEARKALWSRLTSIIAE